MSHVRRHCFLLAAAALSAAGCENNAFLGPTLSGAVVTVVDSSGTALRSATTFALPDTIVEIPVTRKTLDHISDREITDSIRANFVAMGWRDVSDDLTARPDVVVLVAAATRIQTTVVYGDWFSGWGYLPYWGVGVDASWGWGAPVGAIPYEFPAGTLLVAMLDVRTQRQDIKTIPLLWAAAVDGVLSTQTATKERALVGVDQAFAQSAYLSRQDQ